MVYWILGVVAWYIFAAVLMRYWFSLDPGLDTAGLRFWVWVASPILYTIVGLLAAGDWFINKLLVHPDMRRRD